MPASYSRLRLARLRELCALRGILTEGLRKPELIAALRADDDLYVEDEDGDARGDTGSERAGDPGEDEVNDQDGHQLSDDSDDGEVEFGPARLDPPSEALKLKQIELEIERTRLEQLKWQQGNSSVLPTALSTVRPREVKLPTMADNACPLSFFSCWEKTLKLNSVEDSLYVKLLPSHLNEKAARVFASLTFEQCQDYNFVKSQIIASFRATSSHYLGKFRGMKRSGPENQSMFVTRLREAFGYFLEAGEVKTFDQLKENVILEQFLSTLDVGTRQYVLNNCPTNAVDAAKYADIYFQNRPKTQKHFSVNHRKPFLEEGPTQKPDARAAGQSINSTAPPTQGAVAGSSAKQRNACFICQDPNHKQANCPFKAKQSADGNKTGTFRKQSKWPALVDSKKSQGGSSKYEIPVTVNGKQLTGYRDSGSFMTFVQASLFPDIPRTGKIEIFGINDKDAVEVPTAMVEIQSPCFGTRDTCIIEVGLLPYMRWEVLVGNSLFENYKLQDVIQVQRRQTDIDRDGPYVSDTQLSNVDSSGGLSGPNENVNLLDSGADRQTETGQTGSTPTTAPVNTQSRPATARGHDLHSADSSEQQTPTLNDSTGGDTSNALAGRSSDGPVERKKSEDQALGTHADETDVISDNSTEGSTANPADAIAPNNTDVTNGGAASSSDFDSEWTRLASIFQPDTNGANEAESIGHNAFRQAQETDPSLKHWWGLARQSSKTYVIRHGLLWKRNLQRMDTDNEFLLCLPQCYRTQVLRTAHDSLHS